jgi:hypothetical protein
MFRKFAVLFAFATLAGYTVAKWLRAFEDLTA